MAFRWQVNVGPRIVVFGSYLNKVGPPLAKLSGSAHGNLSIFNIAWLFSRFFFQRISYYSGTKLFAALDLNFLTAVCFSVRVCIYACVIIYFEEAVGSGELDINV